ncbi:MAG: endoribonuclease MazF [Pseudobdellovibrionaceae bacterium]
MSYVPHRGDIVWLNFTPQAGHEQRGTRPALVLSPEKYNKKTGLAICCPITSSIKGYPFEVVVSGKKINGAVLSDHLKNLDWKVRKAKFIEKASDDIVSQCSLKISALIIHE